VQSVALAALVVAASLCAPMAGTPALAQATFPDMELKFGHIKVNVFPNSTIGDARALVESMQIGVVDIALVPTTNAASFYPPLDIFYLPFMFRNAEHAYKVSDGPVGQELYDGMLKKVGIRTLAMYESGFRTITTKSTPVRKPDDMKGIKFRVVNNPLNVSTFKALGANPTPMPLSEVFTGLQQGTVDGQDNPVGNVVAFGFDKVQSYITLSHHQWAGIMFLIGDKTWAKLPPNVQELFKKTAVETQDWERKEVNRKDADFLAAMKANGMTVIELTDVETAMFQEKMKDVWEKYQSKIGEKLIKAAVETK
jgi:tripartite ATP-independent transporter DctP family solute receptor